MNWQQRLLGKKPVAPKSASLPDATEDVRQALDAGLASLDRQMAGLRAISEALHGTLAALDRNEARLSGQLAVVSEQLAELPDTFTSQAGLNEPLERRLWAISDWVERSDDQLAGLNDQLQKLNRGFFKANALAETQSKRTESALDTLAEAVVQHQTDLLLIQQQVQQQVRESRLEVVKSMLPVLDGIEQALASGRDYLERSALPAIAPPRFADRVAYALGRKTPPARHDPEPLQAWLDGLSLVRQRLLDILAGEGVRPIPALGNPFDPYKHVAVALADAALYPAAEAGAVVEEQRRGYAAGQRVIRFAEVVVMPLPRPVETPGASPAALHEPETAAPAGAEPAAVHVSAEAEVWQEAAEAVGQDLGAAPSSQADDSLPGEAPDTLDPFVRDLVRRFEERQQWRRQNL